jgi:hypothetical protein
MGFDSLILEQPRRFGPAAAHKHLLNMAQILSAEGASGGKPGVERSGAPGINQRSGKALKARQKSPSRVLVLTCKNKRYYRALAVV